MNIVQRSFKFRVISFKKFTNKESFSYYFHNAPIFNDYIACLAFFASRETVWAIFENRNVAPLTLASYCILYIKASFSGVSKPIPVLLFLTQRSACECIQLHIQNLAAFESVFAHRPLKDKAALLQHAA